MKHTSFFTLILSLLFILSIGSGQQQQRPGVRPFHQGMMENLNLTDSQKKDIEKLNTDFAKQRVEQQAKVRTAQIELHALFKSDEPNKDAIEKKISEISDLQSRNRILGIEHWYAVNKLLTPDQQKIWKSTLERTPRQRLAMRFRQMRDRMKRFFRDRPAPAPGDTP